MRRRARSNGRRIRHGAGIIFFDSAICHFIFLGLTSSANSIWAYSANRSCLDYAVLQNDLIIGIQFCCLDCYLISWSFRELELKRTAVYSPEIWNQGPSFIEFCMELTSPSTAVLYSVDAMKRLHIRLLLRGLAGFLLRPGWTHYDCICTDICSKRMMDTVRLCHRGRAVWSYWAGGACLHSRFWIRQGFAMVAELYDHIDLRNLLAYSMLTSAERFNRSRSVRPYSNFDICFVRSVVDLLAIAAARSGLSVEICLLIQYSALVKCTFRA